jgi:hypothetical protein
MQQERTHSGASAKRQKRLVQGITIGGFRMWNSAHASINRGPAHANLKGAGRMSASRQQPPFANRMFFSAKATWARDSHELRSPSLHHPISAQSSLLTDDYGGDSEALISDMTEQCRHSCCDHYPLVRNRRRCPEDKWLLDMKRGHQVLFLRLFTKSWCPTR